MATKRKPILLVSSAVYGFEELLDRIYTELVGFDHEVWMSHKGTMPVHPEMTALESCLRAVQDCDLFLGIILPRYGSGEEKAGADSITHEELKWAIHWNKPRWILAHDHVVFARTFLDKLGYDAKKRRAKLKLKPSTVFQDLRAIDMYELAARHDVQLYRDRKGNWVQKFGSPEEAQLFTVSQFRRFQEAEKFVQDSFAKPKAILKVLDGRKEGRP
jgi:Domain of unknown function (DUF4062)